MLLSNLLIILLNNMNISIDEYDLMVLQDCLVEYCNNHYHDWGDFDDIDDEYRSAISLLEKIETVSHFLNQNQYNALIICKHVQ